jgi:DNA-binding NtrC family response regulator
MTIESTPGEGTTVEVRLPAVEPASGEREPARSPAAAPAKAEPAATVMLVEDDDQVRDVTRRILVEHGFDVIPAASGEEALELAERPEVCFDVILTDHTMPGMSGLALLEEMHRTGHEAPAVVMSGYVGEAASGEGDSAPVTWLHKPFGGSALVETIREALEPPAS